MTKPINFPGRKTERRLKVIERLESQLEYIGEIREDRDSMPNNKMFSDENIKRINMELSVLRERVRFTGKRFTKKIKPNIGRR